MMREGKAVFVSAIPKFDAVGGVKCNFLIFCPDHSKKRADDGVILSTFARIGASDTSPEQFSAFAMSYENLSEADKTLARLRTIVGVQNVRMRIIKELIVGQDWLRE
jgi:hypothetical protein